MTRPSPPYRLWAATALLAGLVAACAAERHAERRDEVVDVPESYGDTDVDGLETDAWCSDFGHDGLDRLVEKTWSDNLELKAAWARLEQAKARAAQARSHLLPELRSRAGVTASNQTDRLPDSLRGDGGDGPSVGTRWEASLAASYEVDLWGKYRHRARAAELEVRATRSRARALAMTLTSRVAEAWFDVVAARERVELLDEQIELSEEFLAITEARFRQGLASELDLTQQRQNLESLRGERVDARLELETSRHRLAVLSGAEPGELGEAGAEQLPEIPPIPEPGVPADLLERRPDVRAALFRLRAADERTAAAVADQLPTLDLSARLFLQAGSVANLLDELIWSVSAIAAQTLFDGGRLRALEREAESVAEEYLYLYGQTLLEALEDVRTALVGDRRQRERIESLEEEQTGAEQALEAARSQYREGNIDYFRVLDALQRLQELQRQVLEARRRRVSYRISLCRALGGSWTESIDASIDEE